MGETKTSNLLGLDVLLVERVLYVDSISLVAGLFRYVFEYFIYFYQACQGFIN